MAAIGALVGLTSLEDLSFHNIKGLRRVPSCVAQLPLRSLALCYCPIATLPPADAVRVTALCWTDSPQQPFRPQDPHA